MNYSERKEAAATKAALDILDHVSISDVRRLSDDTLKWITQNAPRSAWTDGAQIELDKS